MTEEKDVSIGDYIKFTLSIIVNLRKKGKTKEEVTKFLDSASDTPSLKELDGKLINKVYAMPIEMIN
jgi:hypothetical protein